MKISTQIRDFLNQKVKEYNQKIFIASDPISIPHRFSKKQDIEIAGFFAAVFAWGNRTTIINKCNELMLLMDNAPYEFITQHKEIELKKFLGFKHRTFNTTDLLHFIRVLRHHYGNDSSSEQTLESAFTKGLHQKDETVENALRSFHDYFFSLEDSPGRTKKHISTPANNSSCKRLNMFLRWMVRRDPSGVDFGIWKGIRSDQLVCPLDIHVQRVAVQLGLITDQKSDWKTAEALTHRLKELDPHDPVKYDIALFSMGVNPA
ncbi:MAG: TIGR02757 family protein [Bacteroidota bacterium]